ncbi:MAG: hypothetical protein AAFW74_14425, partial [Pseudomonadota bacterium]
TLSFLTIHASSVVAWRPDNFSLCNPYAAYHVPYPDGGIGVAKVQQSDLGNVSINQRPWRRLLQDGKSWWPGTLTIKRDQLRFTDHPNLMDLWIPNPKKIAAMRRYELSGQPAETHFIWPELYIDMTKHQEFLDCVRNDDFAASTFVFLRDKEFVREADEKQLVVASERRFGDMLGAWRRCGESYLDFYLDCGPGSPSDQHISKLERLFGEAGYVVI